MKNRTRTPLIFIVITFAAGIFLSYESQISVIAASFLFASYFFFCLLRKKRFFDFFILVLLFGVWRSAIANGPDLLRFQEDKTLCQLEVLVTKPPFPSYWFSPKVWPEQEKSPPMNRFIGKIQKIWTKEGIFYLSEKALFRLDAPGYYWRRGTSLTLLGFLRPISPPTNPGEYSRKLHWKAQGVRYQIDIKQYENIRVQAFSQGCPFLNFCSDIRQQCCEKLLDQLGPRRGGFAIALVLGDRSFLSREDYIQFQQSGLLHLIAISGLHVSLLFSLINITLRRFWHSYTGRSFTTIFILVLYAFFSGLQPPIVRATLVLAIYTLAPLFGRKTNSLNSLGVAAFLILCFRPLQLFLPGFQLSFVACWLIIQTVSMKGDRDDSSSISYNKNKILQAFLISWVASLATFPLTAYHFHQITPWSWLFSVLTLPFIVFSFLGTLLLLFSPFALGWGESIILFLLTFQIDFLWLWIGYVAQLPSICLTLFPPWAGLIIAYYAILFYWPPSLSIRDLSHAALILTLILFLGQAGKGKFLPQSMVTILDVGHGSSIYIRLPGPRHILYDCGSCLSNIAPRKVLPFLRTRGVDHLDAIIVSHYDSDHYNGVEGVLSQIPVHCIVVNPIFSQRASSLVNSWRKRTKVVIAEKETKLAFLPEISFFDPGSQLEQNENDNEHSLVALVKIEKTNFLFTGDIEIKSANILQKKKLPPIQFMQVPHHGSYLKNTDTLLKRWSPRYALLSARRNFPSLKTIESYKKARVTLFSTWEGAIDIYEEGGKWKIFQNHFR